MEELRFYRKCSCCKNLIDITSYDETFFMKPIGKSDKSFNFYHIDCFITDRKKLKNPWTDEHCQQEIDKWLKYTKDNLIKKTAKRRMTDFLKFHYSDINIPKGFYSDVLTKVYQGNYKNFKTPVPPEDLLDMWQQKADVLDRHYAKKQSNDNKHFEPSKRLHYDLVILLNNYNNYLQYKNKQKQINDDIENLSNSLYIDTANMADIIRKNSKKDIVLEVDNIVNDIF